MVFSKFKMEAAPVHSEVVKLLCVCVCVCVFACVFACTYAPNRVCGSEHSYQRVCLLYYYNRVQFLRNSDTVGYSIWKIYLVGNVLTNLGKVWVWISWLFCKSSCLFLRKKKAKKKSVSPCCFEPEKGALGCSAVKAAGILPSSALLLFL